MLSNTAPPKKLVIFNKKQMIFASLFAALGFIFYDTAGTGDGCYFTADLLSAWLSIKEHYIELGLYFVALFFAYAAFDKTARSPVALVVIISATIIFSAGAFVALHTYKITAPVSFKIRLPENYGVATLTVKCLHPFLAESDSWITINEPGGKRIEKSLFPQFGGQPGTVIIWYPRSKTLGPFVLLQHAGGGTLANEYIDLTSGISYANVREAQNNDLNEDCFYDRVFAATSEVKGTTLGWVDNGLTYHANAPTEQDIHKLFPAMIHHLGPRGR